MRTVAANLEILELKIARQPPECFRCKPASLSLVLFNWFGADICCMVLNEVFFKTVWYMQPHSCGTIKMSGEWFQKQELYIQ